MNWLSQYQKQRKCKLGSKGACKRALWQRAPRRRRVCVILCFWSGWLSEWLRSLLLLLRLRRFSRVWLCDPIDGSPPGSPVPGILQARILEWVAISFSNAWKWRVKVKLLSRVRLLVTPWTTAYQAPPSMGFSGKSTGVGCHCLLLIMVFTKGQF